MALFNITCNLATNIKNECKTKTSNVMPIKGGMVPTKYFDATFSSS